MKIEASLLQQWVDGTLTEDVIVTGLKVDQRLVSQGDLFVCLKGERVDGHNFAQAAVDQGASLLLVDHHLDIDVPQLIVPDTYQALIQLGASYRQHLDAFIIAITGSNGKTSTKDILHSILEDSIATHENQNTVIGTVLNLFRMDENTRYGIFEVGLDMPGDIDAMASFLLPDAAIITSLAPAHMSNFEDVAHIAKEKFRLFHYVHNKNYCFYQGDFELYRALAHQEHSFGFNDDNEAVATEVKLSNQGVDFKFKNQDYHCNLLGKHQASNSVGIIALLQVMGIDGALIKEGLSQVALTSLRTEIIQKNEALILLDAYKSNKTSLLYALDILTQYDHEGPFIAFLSDMVELGDISSSEHIEVLNAIAKRNIKHLYTIGTEFQKAQAHSNLESTRFTNCESMSEFKALFNKVNQTPCMILIKGSRSFALEQLMKED